MIRQATARRQFLQYLAASPLLATTDALAQENIVLSDHDTDGIGHRPTVSRLR